MGIIYGLSMVENGDSIYGLSMIENGDYVWIIYGYLVGGDWNMTGNMFP